MSVIFIILVIALVCFLLATFGVNSPVNLTALGLAFVVIYYMISTHSIA